MNPLYVVILSNADGVVISRVTYNPKIMDAEAIYYKDRLYIFDDEIKGELHFYEATQVLSLD